MENRRSSNYDARPAETPVDTLVLHYTGMANAEAALDRLCDEAAGVSAHYLIDEGGSVFSLVAEEFRAWHAGVAWWRGHSDINARSIGIELVNPGHEFGLTPFPEPQVLALINLACGILERHRVPSVNVVGHSDIAPRRKQDPGELFDWPRLARAGIGLWPGHCVPQEMGQGQALQLLAEIGYETTDLKKTIEAFQRRYRPRRINGIIDRETAGMIASVLAISLKYAI